MFTSLPRPTFAASALMHGSPLNLFWASASFAVEALAAWLVIAVPMVAFMTLFLTAVLRKVPAFASVQARD
jgi:hypothetical protein